MVVAQKYRMTLVSWVITGALSCAFLVLLKPTLTHTFEFLNIPLSYSQSTCNTLVFLIGIVFICIYARRIGIDLFGGCAIALVGAVGLSTMFNQGDMSVWVNDWIPCLAVALVVGALAKTRPRELLRSFFFACTFYVLCNLVYILQVFGGFQFDVTENLFYSYRTATWRIAIPASVCSVLLDNMDGRCFSVRSGTVFLVCFAELLVGYTATSALAFVILGVLVALVQLKVVRRILNGVVYLAGYLAAFVSIVILRLQEHLGFIIEGVLHRSLTFTGRTAIWDVSMQLLGNSHLFTGYGASYVWNAIVVDGQVFKHAHNELLHVLLAGGAIALVALLAMMAIAALQLFRSRRLLSSAVLAAGLGCLLLIGLVEELTYPAFFFLLALAAYSIGDLDHFASE